MAVKHLGKLVLQSWAAHQSICYRKPVEDFEQRSDMIGIMFLSITLVAVWRNYCGNKSRSRETSQNVNDHFGLPAFHCLGHQPGGSVEPGRYRAVSWFNHIRESEYPLANSIYSFNMSKSVCRSLHKSQEASSILVRREMMS